MECGLHIRFISWALLRYCLRQSTKPLHCSLARLRTAFSFFHLHVDTCLQVMFVHVCISDLLVVFLKMHFHVHYRCSPLSVWLSFPTLSVFFPAYWHLFPCPKLVLMSIKSIQQKRHFFILKMNWFVNSKNMTFATLHNIVIYSWDNLI